MVLIEALGFGHANVVVAVPQAWIDVRTHGGSRRRRHRVSPASRPQDAGRHQIREPDARLLRSHGIIDYRIVESSGATEGAPAAGTAEMIVDITTTGATLAANGLKVVEDGIMLRSQANLVAARRRQLGRGGDGDWRA